MHMYAQICINTYVHTHTHTHLSNQCAIPNSIREAQSRIHEHVRMPMVAHLPQKPPYHHKRHNHVPSMRHLILLRRSYDVSSRTYTRMRTLDSADC